MKRIVLTALLFAAVAMSASAEDFAGTGSSAGKIFEGPNRGQYYSCDYTNYSGSAANPGYSSWTFLVYYDGLGKPMLRGTEHFLMTDRVNWDGYKATWAAPVNKIDPYTGTTYTQWEYTFNPYGPQCKKAGVYFNAFKLTFSECGDGHSRVCWLVQ